MEITRLKDLAQSKKQKDRQTKKYTMPSDKHYNRGMAFLGENRTEKGLRQHWRIPIFRGR